MIKIDKLIAKRKQNILFAENEIQDVVMGYVNNEITDKEMTKFVEYIYENNITDGELVTLTQVMQNSGQNIDLSEFENTADKHSSGGVSDTTTIIIVPILATLGLNMMKMSGGALGFTGGTADKVKSHFFGNLNNEISLKKAKEIMKKTGGCFLTQSTHLVPADKKIYALRDRTNLVDSIPLIASSIASKKLACGAKNILINITCGNGAFMHTKRNALTLAKKLHKIITTAGRNCAVVISDMHQPLGNFVGDDLEVMEALQILQNKTKNRLSKLSIELASRLYAITKQTSFKFAKTQVVEALTSGKAYKKLKEIVKMQNGKVLGKIPQYYTVDIKSTEAGYVSTIDTPEIGNLVKKFQAQNKNFVGIEMKCALGHKITANKKIITLYFNKKEPATEKIAKAFAKTISISEVEPSLEPLVIATIN